ncbi:MAG: glycogen debranching enzyme GlgX, partial [Rhodobacter sp.]|nr:glycogen debranching enzyme GlgX [Rhodobacter sp.]
GPGGYQLGAFPPPFLEWNDRYRDGVRRFWRGDDDMVRRLADRLTGSARQFDHSGRPATSSVNLLTAHDGFTLMDTVTYSQKHNQANAEGNRDGHGENFSDNMGVEGPTEDAAINAARARRRRNMMATLLLSQGTPMILAGDELGRTQGGNNNAYNQDNATTWLDWSAVDTPFLNFTRAMIAFRKSRPILRQKLFLHSNERGTDGLEDLFWRREDGTPMREQDWNDPDLRILCAELRMASASPTYAEQPNAIFAVFNAGTEIEVTLPQPPQGKHWCLQVDTSTEAMPPPQIGGKTYQCPADCVLVFDLDSGA